MAPYAKVAEKKRGLPFKHPVSVRFLTTAEFEKPVTADKKKLNADDRTELRHFAGLMRAFGLTIGNVDPFATFDTFSVSEPWPTTPSRTRPITIRGSKLTAASRATLVHELTHALQDQYFDIGDRLEKLREGSGSGWSTAEYAVLDAIIEGDAERVAGRYRASLSAKQRRALHAGQKGEFTRADKELTRIPGSGPSKRCHRELRVMRPRYVGQRRPTSATTPRRMLSGWSPPGPTSASLSCAPGHRRRRHTASPVVSFARSASNS